MRLPVGTLALAARDRWRTTRRTTGHVVVAATRAQARYLGLRPSDPRYRAHRPADLTDPGLVLTTPSTVTHELEFGEQRVTFHLDGTTSPIVTALFGDTVAAVDPRPGDPEIAWFTADEPGAPAGPVLATASGPPGEKTRDDAIGTVLAALTRRQLDLEPDRSHVHAAAAVVEGRAVVVPGEKGAGKSTLVAHLSAAGSLLNDEVVASSDASVWAVPRPITIKPGGAALVAPITRTAAPDLDAGCWLTPDDLGTTWASSAPAGLIVLPERRPGPPVVTPITAAEALEALLRNSFDLTRRPADRLWQLTDLVASSTCVRLAFDEPGAAAATIVELARRTPDAPVAVEHRRPAWPDGARPPMHAVLIGDRSIIYLEDDRRIVRLDPAATSEWLATRSPDDPAPAELVAQLDAASAPGGAVRP